MLNVDVNIVSTIATTANMNYFAPAAQSTYRNSDNSFNVNINAGDTYVSNDITVTDNTGATSTFPTNVDITLDELPLVYLAPVLPENRTVYVTGDVATQIARGVYNRPAQGIAVQLADFFTLKSNNPFGNTLRFTDINGNAINPGVTNYVIDWLQGIGIYINIYSAATWDTAITNGENASITIGANTYNDWRLIIPDEVSALVNNEATTTDSYLQYLGIASSSAFWTALSAPVNASSFAFNFRSSTNLFEIRRLNKGQSAVYFLIRNHVTHV